MTIKVDWTCDLCELTNPVHDGIATTYDDLGHLLFAIREHDWPICTECGDKLYCEVKP